MKYHRQRFPDHDPPSGVHGDCARTVIACLLDLELDDVPHFVQETVNNPGDGLDDLDRTDRWLGERALRRLTFAFGPDEPVAYVHQAMRTWNPGAPYCLIGRSTRGLNHVAIYRDGQLVHDPHPSGQGITAPTEEGHLWVEFLVRVPNDHLPGEETTDA